MARPITIPNVFQNQTGNIPLSQLDTDFSTLATAINDPASYANYAVDSGAVNAYIITLNPAPSTLASMVGVTITFKPLVTNTGASTINVNGFGAINIVNTDSSALISGEIVAGNIFQLSYNGTNFILMSVSTNLANLANVTGVLTESHGGTGTTTGYYGFKNRIINGAMAVSQRGAGGTATNGIYTTDRWYVNTTGTTPLWQQLYGGLFAAQRFGLQLTGAVGHVSSQINQRIESVNSTDLANGVVTVSGWFYQNTGSTMTAIVSIYYATVGVDIWTSGITLANSFNISIPNATWTYLSNQITLPSVATQGIQLAITSTALGASQIFAMSNVQLEKGSTATSFDYRPYGTELALCQRYYTASSAIPAYMNGSGAVIVFGFYMPSAFRATPSISYTGTATMTIPGVITYSSTTQPSSISTSNAQNNQAIFSVTGFGVTVASGAGSLGGASINFSAEL